MVRVTKLKLHRTISDIMKKGDLDKLTTKKIRLICEQKYNMDLTDRFCLAERKNEIDKIVLAFVKKKSKEEDDENSNHQNNVNDEQSSDSSEESGGEESGEDEEESSCSGSESCSDCSSESSDNESDSKVPARKVASASKQYVGVASTSKQPMAVASTSKQPTVITSTSKQLPVNDSSVKQLMPIASTSKQPVAVAIPAKKTVRNVIAPPKKRISQSMNAAAADVAAITAAAAAVDKPNKKAKIADVNNKFNTVAATAVAMPSNESNTPTNNESDANNRTEMDDATYARQLLAEEWNFRRGPNNKSTHPNEMDDAAYARQLQAEEWNFRRGTVNKLFRNTPQKKIDKNEQTKKKKACPFLKKCLLSPALAEVLGTNEMSRPDIVQKMWSVVRERNLFDPSNKQFVLCDEQLAKIFGKKRIRLIGMMKYLKQHVKDVN